MTTPSPSRVGQDASGKHEKFHPRIYISRIRTDGLQNIPHNSSPSISSGLRDMVESRNTNTKYGIQRRESIGTNGGSGSQRLTRRYRRLTHRYVATGSSGYRCGRDTRTDTRNWGSAGEWPIHTRGRGGRNRWLTHDRRGD